MAGTTGSSTGSVDPALRKRSQRGATEQTEKLTDSVVDGQQVYDRKIAKARALNRRPVSPVRRPDAFHINPWLVFYILLSSNVAGALLHPIQDADEVFNYWEPTHYLSHGHGFQTWEYSPRFAIRSWAYAGFHALLVLVGRAVAIVGGPPKVIEFYVVRIALAAMCALCETRLFNKAAASLNPRIAITFLIIMATSPGMFHAAVAYLPSSFSMYTTMLGFAAFLDWRGGMRTQQGIACMLAGAAFGWPFAGAMVIPFVVEEVLFSLVGDEAALSDMNRRLTAGVVTGIIISLVQVAIDCFFYQAYANVPFNIVLYNVFSSKGPALYGTEPWHFYFRNLTLNFHVWFWLALVSLPLLILQQSSGRKAALRLSYLRVMFVQMPFYLWLAIFSLQPHKEERFMYPLYPALAINAAISLHILLASYHSTDPKDLISKVPIQLRLLTVLIFIVSVLALSAFRTAGTITAYSAPLDIYKPLHQPGVAREGDVVCLGKEWYRFPSHFLLPQGVRAKFIRSDFQGLMPGEFSEAKHGHGFGIFPGTWLTPANMNDENREDLGKYTDIKFCNFLIDSDLPSTKPTWRQPAYGRDVEHWEKVKCLPFLDAESTGVVGRLGWVPELLSTDKRVQRVWGEQCLLRRRKKQIVDTKIAGGVRMEKMG